MRGASRISRAALLAALNVVLLAVAVVVVVRTGVFPVDGERLVEYERSSFEYHSMPTDIVIDPAALSGGDVYVLYTNYACPYCAELHAALGTASGGEAGTPQPSVIRLRLMQGSEGHFATQELVSAYMLKLWRTDPEEFASLEDDLFENQDEWVTLDEAALLAWLNERDGQSWAAGDLTTERRELLDAQESVPADLTEVPSLYSNGRRHTGLVYELV